MNDLVKTCSEQEESLLLNVDQASKILGCSARHCWRMPRPLALGALRRWPRAAIEDWIEKGCPSVQEGVVQ